MASIVTSLSGKDVCELAGLTAEDTVAAVKSKIESLTGCPSQSLKLGINKRFTRDDAPISTYGWVSGTPITVIMSGPGPGVALPKSTHEPSPTGQYGYLQIDSYAQKHRRRSLSIQPGPKRWVPLPRGITVESYPRTCNNTTEVQPLKAITQPLRSCLRQRRHTCQDGGDVFYSPRSDLSGGSDSTSASSSENRNVHFYDGVVPGAECDSSSTGGPNANHDWIYIDRDICGFSLYEYAPNVPSHKDFASSQFGEEFLKEFQRLGDSNQIKQLMEKESDTDFARYRQEEKELDKVLRLAGVSANYL